MEEVLDVTAEWYQLGLQLKLKTRRLDSIQAQIPDPKRQLLEMLKVWLTTSDNTSWKILTDALRSRSVGANQLAEHLETKYCLVLEGTEVDRGTFASNSDPKTYVTTHSEPVDREVSVSGSDPETHVTPSPKPVIDLPTSQPQMADMQNLESKFFHSVSLNAMK